MIQQPSPPTMDMSKTYKDFVALLNKRRKSKNPISTQFKEVWCASCKGFGYPETSLDLPPPHTVKEINELFCKACQGRGIEPIPRYELNK